DRRGIRWQPAVSIGADVAATKGRADSGDLELDLVELFTDVADLARDLGVGVAVFLDEMQDVSTEELAALCGACHEISQQGAPLVVVGAGLPHLPVALAASRSYAERLFRYVVVDRLPREMADRALLVPAGSEQVDYEPAALDELYRLTDGYPYFVQAYGKVTWDAAVASPIRVADVHEAAPEAERELAVGFFGARYDRATPAERDYMRTMAGLGVDNGDSAVTTADIAATLGRRPQSLSPARDGLIKKGLVYSSERGTVAFTVPHFGRFLRSQRT
ncbi:MAG: ATP-binding protein, partial [Nocardioides sp.]